VALEVAARLQVFIDLVRRYSEEKPLNGVFCALSAAFCLALSARVYDSSRTTTTPEKLP
jgi:type VI protein secretion system component VasK